MECHFKGRSWAPQDCRCPRGLLHYGNVDGARGEGRENPVEQPRNPQPKLVKRENQGRAVVVVGGGRMCIFSRPPPTSQPTNVPFLGFSAPRLGDALA